jgi:hypothetical protein
MDVGLAGFLVLTLAYTISTGFLQALVDQTPVVLLLFGISIVLAVGAIGLTWLRLVHDQKITLLQKLVVTFVIVLVHQSSALYILLRHTTLYTWLTVTLTSQAALAVTCWLTLGCFVLPLYVIGYTLATRDESHAHALQSMKNTVEMLQKRVYELETQAMAQQQQLQQANEIMEEVATDRQPLLQGQYPSMNAPPFEVHIPLHIDPYRNLSDQQSRRK